MALHTDYSKKRVDDFVQNFQKGQIDLEPGFQRNSVWTETDRRRLIQSIVAGYPLPNIFLYRRNSRGKTIYEVIDGKQRLETILKFMGVGRFKRDRFAVKLELNGETDWWTWRDIKRQCYEVRHRFDCTDLQTVEVEGDLSDIIDLFVRINSTGKRLTSGEKRNANFYASPFLKEADRLVDKHAKYLLQQDILTQAQLDRMKGTELFSELLMSINQGSPINKKTALDRGIANNSINGNSLGRISREFGRAIGAMRRIFPSLRETRFCNSVEFYTLFLLVWEMQHDELILTKHQSCKLAQAMLRKLSTGVDELRHKYRTAKSTKPQAPYSDYLLTVQGDTDSAATRERRAKILRPLIRPLFEYKDGQRAFSAEQRRIIWNTDATRKCPACRRLLTWDDFTVDHVIAHMKGGRTSLSNAKLMCRQCNSKKGAS